MPSTVPGVVVEAGASGAPASSGMASGPSGWDAGCAVEVGLVALAAAVLEAVALELELALPQAARRQAASIEISVQTCRGAIAAANGSERGAMISCASMSTSGP